MLMKSSEQPTTMVTLRGMEFPSATLLFSEAVTGRSFPTYGTLFGVKGFEMASGKPEKSVSGVVVMVVGSVEMVEVGDNEIEGVTVVVLGSVVLDVTDDSSLMLSCFVPSRSNVVMLSELSRK